jgi:hypothetical protein
MIIQKTLDKVDIPLDSEQFQQFIEQEKSGNGTHLVKVVGVEGAITLQPWLSLTKDDIQGEFNFDIEMGSTQPINEETRKRDALTLAQVLTGNPTIKPVPAFGQLQQQQAEQVGQAELQERQMKDQTDLQKTQMKTESSERTAQLKATTELAKTSVEQQTERGKTGAKVFADMVRGGGKQEK